MLNHLKFVSKVPWVARWTWIGIMLLATLFASQWGVSAKQIQVLFAICGVYSLIMMTAYYCRHSDNDNKRFLGFVIDLAVWSVYIYASGGASNPLITLFLTIVSVAAIVLNTRYIIGLSGLAVLSYLLLWHFYQPIMMHHAHGAAEKLHLLGMFGVFVVSLVMLTAITVYFKAAMNRSYQALEQAQQAIHQQRRLLAVSSFAANIAHEMSTPIASMQLLTDDIASQLDIDDELVEDIELLRSQIQVCRHSLDTLKSHIQVHDAQNSPHLPRSTTMTAQLDTLLPKLVSDWHFLNPHVQVTLTPINLPIYAHISSEQLYAILINVLNNAMQAGATRITMAVEQQNRVSIKITDNGFGIDTDQLSKIKAQQPLPSQTGWGMGLALSKTVLDYVEGELTLEPLHDKGDKNKTIGTQVIIYLAICHDYQQPEKAV